MRKETKVQLGINKKGISGSKRMLANSVKHLRIKRLASQFRETKAFMEQKCAIIGFDLASEPDKTVYGYVTQAMVRRVI